MSQSIPKDGYAFGVDELHGCPCPFLAKNGEEPTGEQLEVAEMYDDYARDIAGKPDGILPERKAERAFKETVDAFKQFRDEHERGTERWEMFDNLYSIAEETYKFLF